MPPYLPLAILAIATLGVLVLVKRHERRRASAVVAYAASLGYRCDPGPAKPPDLDFELFSLGHVGRMRDRTWRDGCPDSVFDYEYVERDGGRATMTYRSAALVAVPFDAPHLRLGPQGFWSSLGRAVGHRDIEVESPSFNDRFRVRCADERFAITLLDQRMIAWMLSPASGRDSVCFEFHGPWMLCWGDRLTYQQLIPLLEWAQAVRDYLPTVVTSLYPAAG